MATTQELLSWRGHDLLDQDGDKIGKIEEIYEDTDTGAPEWALVNTGLFGSKSTFVPLRDVQLSGDEIRVPFEKSHVKDAPGIDPDGALSREDEQRLYQHYGMSWSTSESGSGLPEGGTDTTSSSSYGTDSSYRSDSGTDYDRDSTASGLSAGTTGTTGYDRDRDVDREGDAAGTVGHDTSGPTTDDAMTRSEEELDVGTTEREAGRARLRKYIVTENVETTVPVQREEVRLEREPITDANVGAATSGPDLSEEEHEVTLHAEQPVVEKTVVPKERVRLEKDTVTDEERVSEEVRKEQIEMEGDERVKGDSRL
jgi:uncharacterized protein (TIGR02271 family)